MKKIVTTSVGIMIIAITMVGIESYVAEDLESGSE